MKNEQQEEAKDLYFNSNLSKTEIADKVGVSRKTIANWSRQGNWDHVRQSARSMPSLITEKCYNLIDHYLNSLLADSKILFQPPPLALKDVQTIYMLASTINKLKNRSTANESMEMFNSFLGGLTKRTPELAEQVAPYIEEFRDDASLPFPQK